MGFQQSELQTVVQKENIADVSQVVNLLGLHWNISSDKVNFIPKRTDSTADSAITKRKVVQCSSRIFDPLGVLCPVTICAKLFMQQLWQKNVGWDEPLEQSVRDKWNNIEDELQKAIHIFISRCYFPTDKGCNIQELYTFADASLKAYRAVVYIQQGSQVSFVIAKTHVAPLSKITLPKLKLMAALVATRLTKFVVTSLDGLYHDIPIHLWSDSQIVLHWIGNQKKQKLQFVSHHVQEITQTFPSTTWNYCLSGDSPADHLTQGTNSEVLEDPLWMQSPHLLTDKSKWPQWKQTEVLHLQTETTTDTNEAISAERTPQVMSTEQVPQIGIHNVLKISNYSSLSKLLRITAYLLRFVNNVRNLAARTVGALSTQETNNALSM